VNEASVAAASPTLEAALNGLAEALFDKRTVHLDDTTTTTDQHQLEADDDELLLDENTDLALSSSSLALILPLVGAVLEDAPSPAAAQVALRLVAAHAGGAQLDDDVSGTILCLTAVLRTACCTCSYCAAAGQHV
jgi:hypothetical protein